MGSGVDHGTTARALGWRRRRGRRTPRRPSLSLRPSPFSSSSPSPPPRCSSCPRPCSCPAPSSARRHGGRERNGHARWGWSRRRRFFLDQPCGGTAVGTPPAVCPAAAGAAAAARATVDADSLKGRGRRRSLVGVSAEPGPAAEPGGRRRRRLGGGGVFLSSRAVVPLCVLPRGCVLRHRRVGWGAQVWRHVEVLRARKPSAANDACRARVGFECGGNERR